MRKEINMGDIENVIFSYLKQELAQNKVLYLSHINWEWLKSFRSYKKLIND